MLTLSASEEAPSHCISELELFLLTRDGRPLHTIEDGYENGSVVNVLTGKHLNWKREAGTSINQAVTDLSLARGTGVTDEQMVAAVEKQGLLGRFEKQPMVNTLQRLTKEETPLVADAACHELQLLGSPCQDAPGTGAQTRASVTVRNLTHPSLFPQFKSGDRIETFINGAPRQEVFVSTVTANKMGTRRVGVTDSGGRLALTEAKYAAPGEISTEVWSLGNSEASPAVSFSTGTSGSGGAIVTKPVGNTRDKYGMGLSAIWEAPGRVSTYSATEFTHLTALQYDIESASTLNQDGKPIKQQKTKGFASASEVSEGPAVDMNDYRLNTDHYAIAFWGSRDFDNPLNFADRACFGGRSTCQLVPVGGPPRVPHAEIHLASTTVDQSSMPWDPFAMFPDLSQSDKADVMNSVLDTVLLRTKDRDDEYMIKMIRYVSHQSSFSGEAVVRKMQELAEHETPPVRAAACVALKDLQHPYGKSVGDGAQKK